MDKSKMTRMVGGVASVIAGILIIISASMMISKFMPGFGVSTRSDAITVISFFLIAIAAFSILFSVIMIANRKIKYMAIGTIITQIVLIALEITTVVLWVGMSFAVSAIDIVFMVFSVISIIVLIAFLIMEMRSNENHVYAHEHM